MTVSEKESCRAFPSVQTFYFYCILHVPETFWGRTGLAANILPVNLIDPAHFNVLMDDPDHRTSLRTEPAPYDRRLIFSGKERRQKIKLVTLTHSTLLLYLLE